MAGRGGQRSTSWQPGQSGNPGGRPRILRDVQALARVHTSGAIETLATVMNDENGPPAARVAAAQALLDRGWGRPVQAHTGEFAGSVNVTILSGIARRPTDPIIEVVATALPAVPEQLN